MKLLFTFLFRLQAYGLAFAGTLRPGGCPRPVTILFPQLSLRVEEPRSSHPNEWDYVVLITQCLDEGYSQAIDLGLTVILNVAVMINNSVEIYQGPA